MSANVQATIEDLIVRLGKVESTPERKAALIEAKRLRNVINRWAAIPPQAEAKRELLTRVSELVAKAGLGATPLGEKTTRIDTQPEAGLANEPIPPTRDAPRAEEPKNRTPTADLDETPSTGRSAPSPVPKAGPADRPTLHDRPVTSDDRKTARSSTRDERPDGPRKMSTHDRGITQDVSPEPPQNSESQPISPGHARQPPKRNLRTQIGLAAQNSTPPTGMAEANEEAEPSEPPRGPVTSPVSDLVGALLRHSRESKHDPQPETPRAEPLRSGSPTPGRARPQHSHTIMGLEETRERIAIPEKVTPLNAIADKVTPPNVSPLNEGASPVRRASSATTPSPGTRGSVSSFVPPPLRRPPSRKDLDAAAYEPDASTREQPRVTVAPGVVVVHSDAMTWEPHPTFSGVTVRFLFRDARTGLFSALYALGPGAKLPRRKHAASEEICVISGDVVVGDERLVEGAYCRSESESVHPEVETLEGCVLFVSGSLNDSTLIRPQ